MPHPAIMPTYNPSDITFEHGEGAYLFDQSGTRYLDFAAGIAVNALGHAHPKLVAALTEQAQKLWHLSNLYRIPGQERLAQRLTEVTFADQVFFTNSGVEAVECALKAARRHAHVTSGGTRHRIVTFEQAFHGRSIATIAAAGQEKLVKDFGPLPDWFDIVSVDDRAAIEAAIGDETAAILIEPVQGEGGVKPVAKETLQLLRSLADDNGLSLIFDEIQCGMGRTGKLFAHEWAGVEPDIMASAKGIGGGFPLGACLMTKTVGDTMGAGSHGSTYGGNPLAMAVGNAVLDEMLSDGFLETVCQVADRLRGELLKLKTKHSHVVAQVRGQGLMLGLRCVDGIEARDVMVKLRDNKLITAPAGDNVVRLLPPLIIGDAEIDEAVAILDKTLSAIPAPA